MKLILSIIFSIFFVLAIGVHFYFLYEETDKRIIYHTIYIVTYLACWWAIYSKNKHRASIYLIMMLFPFIAHFYYAVKHILDTKIDVMFWVCIVVVIILPLGLLFIQKTINPQTEDA